MPGLGPGGRRFESFHPDNETVAHSAAVSFFALLADIGRILVGMKGFGKPHFISLRESAPSGSLATLRDRGLTRRLARSNTLVPALILNFQFSARPEGTLLQSEATKRILNYFIKRLGGNKKGVPLQSGKQNGLNQSFPIIELCA